MAVGAVRFQTLPSNHQSRLSKAYDLSRLSCCLEQRTLGANERDAVMLLQAEQDADAEVLHGMTIPVRHHVLHFAAVSCAHCFRVAAPLTRPMMMHLGAVKVHLRQ